MDPPQMIIDGALENHYKMIKQVLQSAALYVVDLEVVKRCF